MPKLRFPEFRDGPDWEEKLLGSVSALINDRAGTKKLTPMSITSGVGLVSQAEKFGREIAGNQYRNYLVIKRCDFAYNKSATKQYPEGFISLLEDRDEAAVPNSIFVCFRITDKHTNRYFLKHLFDANHHGAWLRRLITVGSRAHGFLNIDPNDLLSMPIKFPLPEEQGKIADCLSSIDELIAAQTHKLDALKAHKKGLMQQLFPAEGETVPKLRFPEFKDTGGWISSSLGEIARITSGGTPSRSNGAYWNGKIPWVTTSLIDFNTIYEVDESISEVGLQKSAAKIFPENTVIMAMYGQGKTRGKVAMLGIKAATNQACAAILIKAKIDASFLFQNLAGRYDEIRKISNAGGQENLSATLIETIPFKYPNPETNEQRKIADCLSSIDDLIFAQTQKIEALKTNKQGLMQQLFPSADEAHG